MPARAVRVAQSLRDLGRLPASIAMRAIRSSAPGLARSGDGTRGTLAPFGPPLPEESNVTRLRAKVRLVFSPQRSTAPRDPSKAISSAVSSKSAIGGPP